MTKRREIKLIWQGISGHFICSDKCKYALSTVIFVNDKPEYIVSTVGAMVARNKEGVYETIGCNRYYETFVFDGVEERESLGDKFWTQCSSEIDTDGISEPYAFGEANKMHQRMLDKWIKIAENPQLLQGETDE